MTQSAVETLHQAIIMAYDRTSDPIQRKQAEDYCVNISRTTTLGKKKSFFLAKNRKLPFLR